MANILGNNENDAIFLARSPPWEMINVGNFMERVKSLRPCSALGILRVGWILVRYLGPYLSIDKLHIVIRLGFLVNWCFSTRATLEVP